MDSAPDLSPAGVRAWDALARAVLMACKTSVGMLPEFCHVLQPESLSASRFHGDDLVLELYSAPSLLPAGVRAWDALARAVLMACEAWACTSPCVFWLGSIR